MSEEAVTREREMDAVCERLTRVYVNYPLGPVKCFVYDTDDTGRIEWIHIIYKDKPDVDHVEVTGMSRQEANDTVAQKIHENWF